MVRGGIQNVVLSFDEFSITASCQKSKKIDLGALYVM